MVVVMPVARGGGGGLRTIGERGSRQKDCEALRMFAGRHDTPDSKEGG